MSTLELNGKDFATQTSSAEPVLASTVTGGAGLSGSTSLGTVTVANLSNTAIVFPAGHVLGTHYNTTAIGSTSHASGTRYNDSSLNFSRVSASSNFIVTVGVARHGSSTGGHFRIGYTRGVASLSISYLGQTGASYMGEEDGTDWHNSSITYKDTTTGTAGDVMYFGSATVANTTVRTIVDPYILVMEIQT